MVRDLREMRSAAGPEEIEEFETDVLAGFVLARSAAGLSETRSARMSESPRVSCRTHTGCSSVLRAA